MEERGYTKGELINSVGNVCALGAIRIASGGEVADLSGGRKYILISKLDFDVRDDATMTLARHVSPVYVDDYLHAFQIIGRWNDTANKETVVQAMRDAANN